MGKLILVLGIIVLTTGCSGTQIRLRTEIQESLVPLLYCPTPPIVERPDLPIHAMTTTQQQNAGEVAKHYKATIRVLQGYSEQLEEIVNSYKETDKAYETLRLELETKLRKTTK